MKVRKEKVKRNASNKRNGYKEESMLNNVKHATRKSLIKTDGQVALLLFHFLLISLIYQAIDDHMKFVLLLSRF